MYVVYHSSDSFAEVTCVSIASLLENNKDFEKIHIFYISKNISEINKKAITEFVEKYNRTISFIDMPDWFEYIGIGINTAVKRWLGLGYSRLFITDLIDDNIDRVIYFDSDTIINKSLKELWETELDDYYMAAVDDCMSSKYRGFLGLPKDCVYCNAGVLLLNLAKWRKDGVTEKFRKYITDKNGYVIFNDQTILNVIFSGKTKVIPLKYNTCTLPLILDLNEIQRIRLPHNYSYNQKDIDEARKSPVIIHFTGFFYVHRRPWVENSDHVFADKYLKYRKLTPWSNKALWQDNRKAMSKLYTNICHKLNRNVMIEAVSFLYNYIRPLKFKLQIKRNRKACKN